MAKGTTTKVMKYELRYLDGCGEFYEMQAAVWKLQKQTQILMNRAIQEAYHWDYLAREHKKATGEYLPLPPKKDGKPYKALSGMVYNRLTDDFGDFNGKNKSSTVRAALDKYAKYKKEFSAGTMSLPSFKGNQPIILHNENVRLSAEGVNTVVSLSLFSDQYVKEHQLLNRVRFSMIVGDGTQRAILSRVMGGEYKLGQCQLIYKRPKWFLSLTYTLPVTEHALDPQKILGVDLGEVYALCAATAGEYGSLRLEGGEITEFDKRVEARKRSMQRQAAYCGEGRIGHGTKTRVADVYRAEDRIAHFRDTINHRYSKALIDYAIKTGCGTIQMEDLTGIKEDLGFPKFLRHWTYHDLQMKIEAKAREHGIAVKKVDPAYTSQRCSRCGQIDPANRQSQSRFCCTACGYKANADVNAAQNLSVKGIDKLIKKELGAKGKQTENA